ncbi:hypothetical protein TEQG_04122 [Trichophyton equinum CBS 127.97]|uniref:Uncharacterized protein n=1 Tax=Trichophyton equinum (strain ATCC MYA-4606 / CBS 127.97) TaxID=559882 RepID=F2PT86_TRIEC|nr:hypothetical protein TEQG_04122 [Trichophyton equinum CBS 127.97]
MPVLHAHLRPSLHKHSKRGFRDNSVNLVLVACGCTLLLLSIFLLFYRAQRRSRTAAPGQLLHQNFRLQNQNMPQHFDGVAAAPAYPVQTIPPAHLGQQHDRDHRFDTPAPPYYPREQDTPPKLDQHLASSSSHPPRPRTPPPGYISSTTSNHQSGQQTDLDQTSSQSIATPQPSRMYT